MRASSTSRVRPSLRTPVRWAAVIAAALLALAGLAALPQAATAAPSTSAWYVIQARSSGLVLDVSGASTSGGAELQQYSRSSLTNQQFRFVDAGDGYYKIEVRHSGMVLDVWEWNAENGATIAQYTDLGGTNQQWQVTQNSEGYYSFVNRFSGKALDVWEWSTASGGRMSQYDSTGATNQQFSLIEVSQSTGPIMEDLDRGVTVRPTSSGNLVSWRLLGTDSASTGFNVYRDGTLLNSSPITGATNYLDTGSGTYTVAAVNEGTVGTQVSAEVTFNSSGYVDLPLQVPSGGTTPDGVSYTYEANDISVGDLDGDGQYEYIVKWNPTNAKDNSQSGYTGNVYIDAYELDGTRKWRIDLGRNIRAGAHYTQFQVYDYDSDGDAEVVMKTADATVSGTGQVIGSSSADYRNSSGYILSGPEYLTIFNGNTGAAIDTIDYNPPRGTVSDWGDSYGNRVDRFLAGTAYLDGENPSMIFSRGYYTRTVIWAVDFNGTDLTTRWTFDSNSAGSQYTGQGAHSLSIADLNRDGNQDIVFGAMAINSNGQPLYNTGFGHGDALHAGDFDTDNVGLEVFMPHESTSQPSSSLNTASGSILFQTSACCDNGRGVAANVTSSNTGAEYWSASVSGLLDSSGTSIGSKPGSTNFVSYWDGDGERELLDGTAISDYSSGTLLTGSGVSSNNGSKSTPSLSADLFGDWREEVVWRTSDNSALRIYSTPYTTTLRMATLMHDPQYRVAIAWQNTAYNQPPHTSYYIGSEETAYPFPVITTP